MQADLNNDWAWYTMEKIDGNSQAMEYEGYTDKAYGHEITYRAFGLTVKYCNKYGCEDCDGFVTIITDRNTDDMLEYVLGIQ